MQPGAVNNKRKTQEAPPFNPNLPPMPSPQGTDRPRPAPTPPGPRPINRGDNPRPRPGFHTAPSGRPVQPIYGPRPGPVYTTLPYPTPREGWGAIGPVPDFGMPGSTFGPGIAGVRSPGNMTDFGDRGGSGILPIQGPGVREGRGGMMTDLGDSPRGSAGGYGPGINQRTGQPLTGAPDPNTGYPDWFQQGIDQYGMSPEQAAAAWAATGQPPVQGAPSGGPPSGPIQAPPQQAPPQAPQDNMPHWMRMRLRRNPGGGGQLGNRRPVQAMIGDQGINQVGQTYVGDGGQDQQFQIMNDPRFRNPYYGLI